MPITELALLHLKPTVTTDDAKLQSTLRSAKYAMEAFTGYPFHLYTQVEDPSYIYIIGSWTSLTQHVEQWIPSKENQAVLQSAGELLDVEWMFHLDVDQMAPKEDLAGVMPFSAPTIAIERHFVETGRKREFQTTFEKNKRGLIEFTVPQSICGGWRIDREPEKGSDGAEEDEFVLFSGWRDVAHHSDFARSNEYETYEKTKNSLASFEVRHARRWEI